MDFGISVQDLLNTKYMRDIIKVVAGEKGLSKRVSWVHVLEIRDIVKECVNGSEMILTTGIGFTSKDVAINFLKELIDQDVSALCIEMPLYYHQMDQEMIDLANLHDFPLIEITEISRFVDITKALNTMVINNDAELFHDADRYDQEISETKGTIVEGIRYTAEYLDLDIAYLPVRGKRISTSPNLIDNIRLKIDLIDQALKDEDVFIRGNIAIKHFKIFDNSWGHLIFNSNKRDISHYDILIMKRLSNKIKNDILAELLAREQELHQANEWIGEWMKGHLSENMIKEKLKEAGHVQSVKDIFVCATNLCCSSLQEDSDSINKNLEAENDKRSFDDFLLHTTINVRRVFEDEGFSILGYMENDVVIFIILNSSEGEDPFEGIENAIEKLRNRKNQFMDYKNSVFSVGKRVNKLIDVKRSYETALETLNSIGEQCSITILYDKLYVDRILRKIDNTILEEYTEDLLGELLDPGNVELLQTLKVYFEYNCSKQKTAEKLFIVRQTLYFRLQKVEDIIGKDFDAGEKRLSLELAIRSHFYLLKQNSK